MPVWHLRSLLKMIQANKENGFLRHALKTNLRQVKKQPKTSYEKLASGQMPIMARISDISDGHRKGWQRLVFKKPSVLLRSIAELVVQRN